MHWRAALAVSVVSLAALAADAAADGDPLDAPPAGHDAGVHAAAIATATATAARSTTASTLAIGGDAGIAATFGASDPGDPVPEGPHSAFAGGSAELLLSRGALPTLGYRVAAYAGVVDVSVPEIDHGQFLPFRVGASYDRADVPLIGAAREVLRRPFDRRDIDVDGWILRGGASGWAGGMLRLHVDAWTIAQTTAAGAPLALDGDDGHADPFGLCHDDDDARWCIGIGAIDFRHAQGAFFVESVAVTPVALRELDVGGVHLDARVGWGWGNVWLPGHAPHGDPNAPPCEDTGDCIHLRTGSYDVHARAPIGDRATLDARAARRVLPTVDGELVVEDRAEASLAWAGRAGDDAALGVTATGFAARARRWIFAGDRLVPAPPDATGGGNVTVALTAHAWQIAASAGAARTDYGVLDGATPAPAFAATGSLSLRRDWKDALAR